MFTRTWRGVRGEQLDQRPGREDHLLAPGGPQARARASSASLDERAGRRQARPRRGPDRPAAVLARACGCGRGRLPERRSSAAARRAARADGARPGRRAEAEGRDRRPREEVSGDPDRQPRRLPAHALQEPRSRPRPTRSRSARSAWRRPPGSTTSRTRQVNPSWHVPNSDWAGALAGQVIPGGSPRTRSRRAGWASTTAPASTGPTDDGSLGTAASHGCIRMRDPRRDRPLRRRSPSARPSTSAERGELLAAISSTGTSSQPCPSREAWWSEWRMHSAPMYTPLVLLAHHRVPQVVASPVPWMRNHGGGGARRVGRRRPRSSWRPVAT